jgi:hypothetical protein
MHSSEAIEDWMEGQLAKLLPHAKGPVKFSDLPISTWIVATDLRRRQAQVWSKRVTGDAEVARAVRASCSIPGFFQPVDGRYVDGGVLSNLPTFVFYADDRLRPLAKRTLAFLLDSAEESAAGLSVTSVARDVADAVVDGSRDLQLRLLPDVHVVQIRTGDIKATDFEKMSANVTKVLVEAGRLATEEFFEHEAERIRPPRPSPSICAGREEMYAAIVENLDRAVQDIFVADEKCEWVYALFPSLLYWRNRGIRIRALVKRGAGDAHHGPYQRRLLQALGVEVVETTNVPASAWLFDSSEVDAARAVVRIPESSLGATAVRYAGRDDFAAISAIRSVLEAEYSGAKSLESRAPSERTPGLVGIDEKQVFAALQRVSQYKSHRCRIAVRRIPLTQLFSLSRYVREYKFRQIARWIELYEITKKLDIFEPAAVLYADGGQTIATPPVVEEVGRDRYVLIEGTTRATYCYRQGVQEFSCIVVNSPDGPLPSRTEFSLKDITVVGTTLPPHERYDGFNHQTFRHIEFAVHPTDSLQ